MSHDNRIPGVVDLVSFLAQAKEMTEQFNAATRLVENAEIDMIRLHTSVLRLGNALYDVNKQISKISESSDRVATRLADVSSNVHEVTDNVESIKTTMVPQVNAEPLLAVAHNWDDEDALAIDPMEPRFEQAD